MGQIQQSTMETRFVGLCKRWMVASKLGIVSGTDDNRLEPRCRPENLESLRYVLKHTNYGCSNIFQLFDTTEKRNHLVASRRRRLESQKGDDARQESGRNE